MKLLINTATENKEIALFSGSKILTENWSGQRDIEIVLPSIEKLLEVAQADFTNLEQISVVYGPGSFTSLRIGIATANTIASEVGAKLKIIKTEDYITARLGYTPDLTLLKAGGSEVHVIESGLVQGLKKLSEINLKGKSNIAVDFTEKLLKQWDDNHPIITHIEWLELNEEVFNIGETVAIAEPRYLKGAGITMPKS